MSAVRVMLWVQHLLGIGHQRRAALIARSLRMRGAEVCYVSGGDPVPDLDLGGARLVQLPPARAADARYRTLLDAEGNPVSPQWRSARREALLETFDEFRPQVLITETYPFGRRLLRFELEPLIDRAAAARPRPRLVSSVRDILQARSATRNADTAELIRERFDLVLVHGDPALVELSASFPPANLIRGRIRYTGYVVETGPAAAGNDAGCGVLVSGGGGVVAEKLLETALEARPRCALQEEPWRVLAGPAVSAAAFSRLKGFAADGVCVERNRPDFPQLLAACRVSVSQAGYNTLLEGAAARARAVVVPFSGDGENEQPMRAALWARKGLITVLPAEQLDPIDLAEAMDRAAQLPRPAAGVLDLEGAERSAELVLGLASECGP